MEKDEVEKKEKGGSSELKVIGAGLSRTGTLSTRYQNTWINDKSFYFHKNF